MPLNEIDPTLNDIEPGLHVRLRNGSKRTVKFQVTIEPEEEIEVPERVAAQFLASNSMRTVDAKPRRKNAKG
jgi:hypothetical protein